jgi:phosphate transport system permease protein
MKRRSRKLRHIANECVRGLSAGAAVLGLTILGWILFHVILKGAGAMNFRMLFQGAAPPGAGGGIGNAITGSLIMVLLAVLMGVPAGVMAGIYLSEFGRKTRIAGLVRSTANVLTGVPTILTGLFIYSFIVLPSGHFSGWAGSAALALIILPITACTTEDTLIHVPDPLREASSALGAPLWKTTWNVLFRSGRSGLITGILLAVARVAGETAPLLFTAMNSSYWPEDLSQPTANLPVTMYNYALSPYKEWQSAAWAGAFLITATILSMTLFSHWLADRKESGR